MNFFSTNLKFLRKEKNLTQEDFAAKIGINRPKVGSYEEGRAEPKMETLQSISHFFRVKIDDLLEKDLKKGGLEETKDIEGNGLRVLPIVVNKEEQERITFISVKAQAGYLRGYADPEYIEEQPHFHLPFPQLSQGTFRAFQLEGDSMLPLPSGAFVIAAYLENWNWIKDGECYIVVSKEDGVCYKRVFNKLEKERVLELHSDNEVYTPFTIDLGNVLEVWKAVGYVSFDLPEEASRQLSVEALSNAVQELKTEVNRLKETR
jgi:transcriptional regulator with XRE-family HTH domain